MPTETRQRSGLQAVRRIKQVSASPASNTEDILANLAKADRQGAEAVFAYLSAFPALETDVLNYNLGNPVVPLVAVYPSDGGVDADNPGLVLKAAWSDPGKQKVAEAFLEYARGKDGHQAYLEVGFRTDRRSAGKGITTANGLIPKVTTVARTAPTPDTVAKVLTAWTAWTG